MLSAPEVVQMVQQALSHHLAGRTDVAEQIYRQALAREPDQADAIHLLGVLLAQRNQFDEALPMLERAVALLPQIGEFHRHVADVYALTDRFADALASYEKAIRLDPRDVNALYGAARQASNIQRDADAANCLQQVVALQPENSAAWADLGIVFTRMGQHANAIQCLEHSLKLNPEFGHALTALSDALRQAGRLDEAAEPGRRGAELQSDVAWAQIAYGNVLQVLARFEEAVAQYEKALKIEPENFDAINNLGLTLLKLGRASDAMEVWNQAVAKWPDNMNLRANVSLGLLTLGDLERGFAHYESRLESMAFKQAPLPQGVRWQGQDVRGKTILVTSEQGIGDTFQFVRYVPLLVERGAKVAIICPKEVNELLRTVPRNPEVRSKGDREPAYDLWVPMASFPFLFKTTLESIPANVPYLKADAARVKKWKERFASEAGEFKVGIVWAGSAGHQNDRARSVQASQFVPLAAIAGVQLYSLQKGAPAKALGPESKIIALGDELKDFSDTAAALEALDLLISVDTSVVHLAGALARPVWTLTARGPDFRWMLDREDSPWYPTMRLFRQPRPHDWKSVFLRVEEELRKTVQQKREGKPS